MIARECPQCGGEVQVSEETRVNAAVTCSWCGTELIVRVRIVLPEE